MKKHILTNFLQDIMKETFPATAGHMVKWVSMPCGTFLEIIVTCLSCMIPDSKFRLNSHPVCIHEIIVVKSA